MNRDTVRSMFPNRHFISVPDMNKLVLALSCVWLCIPCAVASADWRQFRGNDTTGVVAEGDWSGEQSIAWTADLPGRGLSSPIVVGDKVFVTASSGPRQDRLHVLCFGAADGAKQWERQFWATGRTITHPKTCVAAPSPASDGQRIFAFYSSNDLACLDLEGNLLWYRGLSYDYPNASNSLGMSSSALVIGDTVIALVESDDESFSMGIDVATGLTRWKLDRPRKANWTSPSILTVGEKQLALLQSSAGVSAVDPASGEVLWTYADGASTVESLVVSGNTAFVPSHGITAIQPGKSNAAVPDVLWNQENLTPSFASPIVLGEALFVVNSAGVVTCAETKDGARRWQLRLAGGMSASPVAYGGKLYFVAENGAAQVVDPSGKGKILSKHEFGETILSTPAVGEGGIYVRSDGHLWKVSTK
jgi:outer membrane protein assembly factor BamB